MEFFGQCCRPADPPPLSESLSASTACDTAGRRNTGFPCRRQTRLYTAMGLRWVASPRSQTADDRGPPPGRSAVPDGVTRIDLDTASRSHRGRTITSHNRENRRKTSKITLLASEFRPWLRAFGRIGKVFRSWGSQGSTTNVEHAGEDYLTIKNACQRLGVSPNTLRTWGASGKVQEYRHPMNNYRLYRRADIEALRTQLLNPRPSTGKINE